MKRFSIDRIGMRGSVALLLLGTLMLAYGIFLQVKNMRLPENVIEVTAVITDFSSEPDNPITYVSYNVNKKTNDPHLDKYEYENVPLGQYEGSWKINDTIEIYCSAEDHKHIWTGTMQYRGIFFIVLSVSPLLIAIYKIIQFRRIKGINENESDVDTTGEEKFKLSSAIIPLLAGIPFTINGILLGIVEKNSFLAGLIVIIGTASILTGIFSFVHFISYKRKIKAERKNNS